MDGCKVFDVRKISFYVWYHLYNTLAKVNEMIWMDKKDAHDKLQSYCGIRHCAVQRIVIKECKKVKTREALRVKHVLLRKRHPIDYRHSFH